MRSLFNNAPFTRFDLGRHALSQASCPIGQIPMTQDGRTVCVPYSPPSGMFRPQGPFGGVGYGPAMGQAGMSDPYLTQAERDKLLLDIQSATSKIAPLQKLIDWSANNDPGLARYLGADASRFFSLTDSIMPIKSDVDAIQTRLADTDAENWWRPSDQEYAQIKQYTTALDGMWKIYQMHKAIPFAGTPGSVPPPALTAGGPVEGRISTETILVGGAVVVGLGLLISAII